MPILPTAPNARQLQIVRQWEDIDQRLKSVIGVAGMGALFQRALFLAATTHPLLMPALRSPDQPVDTAALAAALAGHPDTEVLAAGEALMQAFIEVLGSLIGSRMTHQLLHPLQAHGGPAPAEPESTP